MGQGSQDDEQNEADIEDGWTGVFLFFNSEHHKVTTLQLHDISDKADFSLSYISKTWHKTPKESQRILSITCAVVSECESHVRMSVNISISMV